MYMPCPDCGCKTRIVTSQSMTENIRKAYWQCLNFNCGTRFSTLTTVEAIADNTSMPPDPKLQPDLCKGDTNQMNLLALDRA